jgi:hypothetical protein
MITTRKVFRLSSAATAGYVITAPLITWLLSIAQTLLILAVLAFIGGCACVVAWFSTPDRWLVIYFGICLAVFIAATLPLVLGFRMYCRALSQEDENIRG